MKRGTLESSPSALERNLNGEREDWNGELEADRIRAPEKLGVVFCRESEEENEGEREVIKARTTESKTRLQWPK